MKALLAIADKVRRDGRLVQSADVERARAEGADDKAIHDTGPIAAAFCMFNRYVDGLGTWAPRGPGRLRGLGRAAGRAGLRESRLQQGVIGRLRGENCLGRGPFRQVD